jgi:anti-sigma B factor antagonist
MPVPACKKTQVGKLAIDGELTIYSAAKYKGELLEALANHEELELDLSEVGEMDSAGLQLLLILKQEAQAMERQLRLTNHSQAVYEILELLNMQEHFGDPVVIPAEWRRA